MKTLAILLAAALTLQGCGTFCKKEQVIIEKIETHTLELDKELTEPCVVPETITTQEFMNLKPYQRESYFSEYSVKAVAELRMCDSKVQSIRKILDKQRQILSGGKADEKP